MTDVITREQWDELKKRGTKPLRVEDKIQSEIINHVRMLRRPDLTYYSIPNGLVPKGPKLMSAVRMGLMAGAPDLYYARPVDGLPGAFWVYYQEVKSPNGRLKPDQREVHRWLTSQHANVNTCYSTQEGVDQLAKWGLLR